jgi:uncharacterized membrane protein YdjX (TVP38/TMEM64 family)
MTKRQKILQSLVAVYRKIGVITDLLVPQKIQRFIAELAYRLPLILSVALVLGALGFYLFNSEFRQILQDGWQVLSSGDRRKISAWVSEFGILGPVFIIGFMMVQMFAVVINVVAIMVVSVLAYGWFWGSVISVTGIFLASTLGYFIGRLLGKTAIYRLIGKKTSAKINEQVKRYGVWAVVIARISPFISNDAISFVAGFAKMSYLKFMLATAAGILPLTLLIGYLGENIDRLKVGLIWVSVAGIAGFIIMYLYDRYRHQKANRL